MSYLKIIKARLGEGDRRILETSIGVNDSNRGRERKEGILFKEISDR
jgi:hypothetical protein